MKSIITKRIKRSMLMIISIFILFSGMACHSKKEEPFLFLSDNKKTLLSLNPETLSIEVILNETNKKLRVFKAENQTYVIKRISSQVEVYDLKDLHSPLAVFKHIPKIYNLLGVYNNALYIAVSKTKWNDIEVRSYPFNGSEDYAINVDEFYNSGSAPNNDNYINNEYLYYKSNVNGVQYWVRYNLATGEKKKVERKIYVGSMVARPAAFDFGSIYQAPYEYIYFLERVDGVHQLKYIFRYEYTKNSKEICNKVHTGSKGDLAIDIQNGYLFYKNKDGLVCVISLRTHKQYRGWNEGDYHGYFNTMYKEG